MATRTSTPSRPSWWRRPVCHFVALGIVIFALDWGLRPAAASSRGDEDLLIERARQLGLDRSDPIVRRRLAQVMRFVLEDRAVAPTEGEVLAALASDPQAHHSAPRTRIEHVYFGPGTPGRAAATAVVDGDWNADTPPLGAVAFVHGAWLGPLDDAGIDRLLGVGVASKLGETHVGETAVLESRFGWHVVRVESRRDPSADSEGEGPPAQVLDDIAARLLAQRRAVALEQGLAGLRTPRGEGWLQ